MKKALILIIALLVLQLRDLPANSAQPGIWNAGGAAAFSLLYPQDSLHFRKIRMVNEFVSIILADGFAAVKGSYWMYNDTPDTVRIRTGYPVNSIFEAQKDNHRTDIAFDDLYKLEVFINGAATPVTRNAPDDPESSSQEAAWYVWNNAFSPMDTVLIQVYFLVNTREATLAEGYTRKHINGFIYLLESGSTWKQPISEGRILVKLDESVPFKRIRGISPDSVFQWNDANRLLVSEFHDLSPSPENNIVISYKASKKQFDFAEAVLQAETYFRQLDELEKTVVAGMSLEFKRFNDPFDAGSSWFSPVMLIVYLPIIFVIACAIVLVIALRYMIRWLRRKPTPG